MFLIVGLGNPGVKYQNTRHNIGFMFVDRLAEVSGIRFSSSDRTLWGKGEVYGKEAIIIKPQTFMNLSGDAVQRVVSSNSVPLESIITAYDDLDLPLGKIRLRKGGGSGGHRGIASMIERLGSSAFPRLRLGIGRPADGDIVEYVLSPFAPGEWDMVEEMIDKAVSSVEVFVKEGIEPAMNRFNANC